MSDNEHDHGGGFFLPVPQEIFERMQLQHDHRMMEVDEYHHSVARLLDSLDLDQLSTLRSLFEGLTRITSGDGQANLAMYQGLATGILHSKFNICFACNSNHDKVFRENQEAAQEQETLVAPDGGDPFKPGEPTPDLQVGQAGMLSDAQLANMEEYGLDDLRSADEGVLIGFMCLNCRRPYQSIEDRMLRPAGKEGCDGCKNKEKWG